LEVKVVSQAPWASMAGHVPGFSSELVWNVLPAVVNAPAVAAHLAQVGNMLLLNAHLPMASGCQTGPCSSSVRMMMSHRSSAKQAWCLWALSDLLKSRTPPGKARRHGISA